MLITAAAVSNRYPGDAFIPDTTQAAKDNTRGYGYGYSGEGRE